MISLYVNSRDKCELYAEKKDYEREKTVAFFLKKKHVLIIFGGSVRII